jgi:hypothetical protein
MVVVKLRERLSACKRVAHKFHMQRFDLRNLNDAEVKVLGQTRHTGLQLWKSWITMWTSRGLGKILQRIYKFQPNRL